MNFKTEQEYINEIDRLNNKLAIATKAIGEAIDDYKKRKLTYGWHDLEYQKNIKALRCIEDNK